jgi:DME family drug/metabolite transporter
MGTSSPAAKSAAVKPTLFDRLIGRLPGAWLVMLAAVCWGTTGTAQAFAPAGATPPAIGTIRMALGGLLMLLWAWSRGAFVPGRAWPVKATLLAGACAAIYQLTFFAGVDRTGVAVGTVVAIGSVPIIAGLLAWLLRGEAPDGTWIVATALAIAGCTLLALGSGEVRIDFIGLLLALGAGGSYALYVLASKDVLAVQPPEAAMGVIFALGAVLLTPFFWFQDFGWLAEPRGWVVALHLGIVTVLVAYWFFARGLAETSVATAVTATLAEPLTATLLGVVVVGETLDLTSGIGVALLLAGLVWLALTARRELPRARVEEHVGSQPT